MPIGGEAELNQAFHRTVTDSGRSSLRLLIDSGLRRKRFLLPDYLCGIVPQVLEEEGVAFGFYPIRRDLSVDWAQIVRKDFDVLYCIDYFGQEISPPSKLLCGKITVWDQVFSSRLRVPRVDGAWCAFNSLRKVTYLPDGSFVFSNFSLRTNRVAASEPAFSRYKYKAKQVKYDYLHGKGAAEKDYLQLFAKGERALDRQQGICGMSNMSQSLLADFFAELDREQAIRRNNYQVLCRYLSEWIVKMKPYHYSFAVLRIPALRDSLRKFLFQNKIYLPVHWPAPQGLDNPLYDEVLSIPLDRRYSAPDMMRVGKLVRQFLKKKKVEV
jgi:hypothetical protein